jgi:hypothetical protein
LPQSNLYCRQERWGAGSAEPRTATIPHEVWNSQRLVHFEII